VYFWINSPQLHAREDAKKRVVVQVRKLRMDSPRNMLHVPQSAAYWILNLCLPGPDGETRARPAGHHAHDGGGQRAAGDRVDRSKRVVKQIACSHAGSIIPACMRAASSQRCFPSYLQLILTERGATKVHGKISFIDLAGSERGADTCAEPCSLSLHLMTRALDICRPCYNARAILFAVPVLVLVLMLEPAATTMTKKRALRGRRSTNRCWL
jgi:hypothetical protein